MTYSEHQDILKKNNENIPDPEKDKKYHCENCGIEVENKKYLNIVNHIRHKIILVCGLCKSYLKRTNKLV